MTLDEIMECFEGENDRFPVGMRVLAVDDDPTCLMLLDGLLRKCQYQVTTTSQAQMALKMLRENKNRFDLVISDVHMPDMDGLKLLELVGLEMDLPVIMLSANSDPRLVMKGITHGACDYLVKPVRIEELRNIWQHVIRRKKYDSKHKNKSTSQGKTHQGIRDNGQEPAPTGNVDQNGKYSRKRRDEDEDEDEDHGDNGHEHEDPGTQKRPRVVWSIELHRKFVAAVNQLGIEKAVPKRILDLMNVEGLTRENVASHLQKYRLYLKRISSVANQQASMAAAFGCEDPSYMRLISSNGLGDFQTLAGPGKLSSFTLSSYPQEGMLGRLNSPSGMSVCSFSSATLNQPSRIQNLMDSSTDLGKFQPVASVPNQDAVLSQGVPTSFLELDQLPPSNYANHVLGLGAADVSGNLSKPMLLAGNPQQMQTVGIFGDHSFPKVASLNPEPLKNGLNGADAHGRGRCSDTWRGSFQPSNISSNPMQLSEPFNCDLLSSNSMRNDTTSIGPHIQQSSLESSPMNVPQEALNYHFGTLNSLNLANDTIGTFNQGVGQSNGVYNRKIDMPVVSQSNSSSSTPQKRSEVEQLATESRMKSNEGYNWEQVVVQNGYDSFDNLMNPINKLDGTLLSGGEFGYDAYPFGSCL